MRTAIILHGTPDKAEYFDPAIPSPSNCHWLPWLQKRLLLANFEAHTPEIPEAYLPRYQVWSQEVERYAVNSTSILVGHSCGGGFFLRWLSENQVAPRRVVLVAPWLDPDKGHAEPDFFNFRIDSNLSERCDLHVLYSDNDSSEVQRSLDVIQTALPKCHYHLFKGYGHFCGQSEFAELEAIVLKGTYNRGTGGRPN